MRAAIQFCLFLSSSLKPTARCFRMLLVATVAWVSFMYLFIYRENFLIVRGVNSQGRKPPKECTFPSADPFAPALENVVIRYPPLDCSKHTPNIVYMDKYVLKVNRSKLNSVSSLSQSFSHCRYKEIARKKEQDKGFEYIWFSGNFTDSIPLPLWHDSVVSECFDVNGTVLSRSYFPLIRKKPETEKVLDERFRAHVKEHTPSETLSIFIIGVDGMSKQNFERAMPKTRNFLLQKMGAIEMHKYNKLAFETFPNVLGLLTGHTPEEFYKDWKYNRTEFVDQINDAFLWTDARKLGYRTGLILDRYDITAFHYQKKGFKTSPVDYYQRATVIASSRDKLMRGNDSNCIGDMPEVTQVHDYWLQMASTFGKNRSTPFFGYSFAVGITHDISDYASKGDEAYLKFLQDLVATDSLDNTVIVWFSDHGPRFGAIRETYHGRIETVTPYLFFVFPPWFKAKYPQLMSTLRINQHRLSSHFDVYETIRDLLVFSGQEQKPGTLQERAISLFREIPKERTCDNAGIPEEFCGCGKFSEPKVTQETLNLLGRTLLDRINSFIGFDPPPLPLGSSASKDPLTNVKNSVPHQRNGSSVSPVSEKSPVHWRDKCARLSMVKVESLYAITNIQLHSMKAKSYRVAVRTSPGSGLFEAMLNYDKEQAMAEVKGDVVRINMYRGQADCVHDPWLRQFCYCL